MNSKYDTILTARANRIARRTVSEWGDKNNCSGAVKELPKIFVKHILRGRTDFSCREKITIPSWAYRKYGKHYFRYYVLHETAHAVAKIILTNWHGHTFAFHKIEKQLCNEWNLKLHRVSAYPKSIDYKGQEVYNARDKY